MKYINARLMLIDDEHTVIVNGNKYMVLDYTEEKPEPKPKPRISYGNRKKKERVHIDQVRPAVLAILKAKPELKSNEIRHMILTEYKLNPASSSFYSMLRRMKDQGLIEVNGVKNGAKWSLKREELDLNPLSEIRGPEEQNSIKGV